MKKLLQFISTLLVIVLLMNMLPMSVFAEKFQANFSNIELSNEAISEETVPADISVVSEITEKRTEYSKEFLMSNGLHMATIYADPVHYETENGWEEIDNTLKTNPDGTYSNTAGVWDVTFPSQLGSNNSVAIEKDGYTLSFSMSGALTANNAAVMSAGLSTAPTQTFAVTNAQLSTGMVQQIDNSAAIQATEHPETVPDKLQSQIAYADVYQNTDIVYDLDSNKVKESMILESYNPSLQGYRYTLEVGSMIPVLGEDGSVTFYDETQENIVMVMPAPYLIDDDGEHNLDIEVQLAGKGSTYALVYLLPTDWLAADDRAWPVVLDPVVIPELTTSNIKDDTVFEFETNQSQSPNKDKWYNSWGMLQAGYYGADEGISRGYLMYENLPSITSSDVIVEARIRLYKPETSSSSAVVEVHKVNTTWASASLTWANKPSYNPSIEDYAVVQNADYYEWEITDIARDWYTNENTGMMFKVSDATEAAQVDNFKQFYSSDYTENNNYQPLLVICFRNNNGLESYWDYTTSSAGRAGTGYVNNYTGNLTWVRDDIGFGGNRMPVTIQHVYNLNDAIVPNDSNNSNDSGGNSFGMGIGWRTNFNQLIYRWNINSDYYVWEDGDGTDHYFALKDGIYKDEDGLELTLTDTGSGTETYCITDKNGNCSYFDSLGRLTKMSNNQATKSSINITYYSTSRLITCITDGIGRRYLYMYDNGMLDRIDYMGSGTTELSYVAFAYNGNNLSRVTDKDGKSSTYSYSGNLLKTAADIDGYTITYTHTSPTEDWQPYRIKSVAESDGSALGGSLAFAYAHNETTITDYNGNRETYQFNDWGNTVAIWDDEGHASFAQFSRTKKDDTAGKANQLKVASKMHSTVGNVLPHASFESGNYWISNASTLTAARSAEAAYHGSYSLKVTSTSSSQAAAVRYGYVVAPGETYTFSAYVKSVDASGQIGLYCDGTLVPGPQYSAGQVWERMQMTYTNDTDASVEVFCGLLTHSAGTVYMDWVQFEQAATASRFNLVENSNFFYSGSPANSWSGTNITSNDRIVEGIETAAPQLEIAALKMEGDPTWFKQAVQHIPCSGSAGDSYVFAGWAKASSAPIIDTTGDRSFSLIVMFNNTDDTSTIFRSHFNPDVDTWQYTANAAVAEKAYDSITYILTYNFNVNTVYFDGIQLFKEEFGSSYTYDGDGNVISVKDLQGQNTTYEYDTGSNLTKIIQDGSAKMTYTYDGYHNVKTATTDTGLSYSFDYDTYGNNIKVSTATGGVTMQSTADYTANGNYLESSTDALGNTTTYDYDANTGVLNWVQYPEDTADTRTEYTYDSMYRMASAACDTNTGNALSAAYTYTDDLLTSIETPSTTYNFTYGDFSLRTGVSVGDRTLATYHYTEETVDDRKYDLDRLDYGNGDSIEYEYDDKGRLIRQTYEDGAYVTNTYDNDDNLAKVYDSESGITTTYHYDLTDRLMKYVESGTGYSHSVEYEYDKLNNLTKQIETTNGSTTTTTYTYDEDNRVKSSTVGSLTTEYAYDAFGRVETQVTKRGSDTILTESYTYKAPTSATTSAQVATYTTTATDGYSVTYTYEYDDNGNITSVRSGANTTTYAYDSANQLIRENNPVQNRTYTWEYDDAGNILNRKEYPYTTGSLDGVTPTYASTYTYGDADWGDLLTVYDGDGITYDQIGNPLRHAEKSYIWQHGRQLASYNDSELTWTYSYDANGMRTQRTDGTTTYKYTYNGSQLTQMSVGNITLKFTYDANGKPLTVTKNGELYYYVTNLQGDVVAILDETGMSAVEYKYDAWGDFQITTSDSISQYNPLTYRGYVYDRETGLYYLQSRYYNPWIGRFINADDYASTGQGFIGHNMFAYCLNNPVNMVDYAGHLPFFVVTGIACALVGGFVGYAITGSWKGALAGAAIGGVFGLTGGAVTAKLLVGSAIANTTTVIAAGKALFSTVTAGVLSQADKIVEEVGSIYRSLTRGNFRHNLQKLTGCLGQGMEAHHVFPVKFAELFAKIGINIHNPLFGAWVDSTHRSWSYAYNKAWEFFFNTVQNPTVEQVFEKAADLAEKFGFVIKF